MRLLYIDKGTPLTIRLEGEENLELYVEFIDNLDERIFYVYNQEIYNDIDKFLNKTALVTINFRNDIYNFRCIIAGTDNKLMDKDIVVFELKSEFRLESRRSSVRTVARLRTKIFEYIENQSDSHRGQYICDAQSEDVSRDGIRLFSDHELDAPKGTMFIIDFSAEPGFLFSIPAKLVRSQRNMASVVYAYDYGFVFDFSSMPELQEKLITGIFKARSRN